ncbi:MAG: hypothetical protein R3D55_25615 [Chloroflexota bacterium]
MSSSSSWGRYGGLTTEIVAVGQAERAEAVAEAGHEQSHVAEQAADACADQNHHLVALAVNDEETAVWLPKHRLDEAIDRAGAWTVPAAGKVGTGVG